MYLQIYFVSFVCFIAHKSYPQNYDILIQGGYMSVLAWHYGTPVGRPKTQYLGSIGLGRRCTIQAKTSHSYRL